MRSVQRRLKAVILFVFLSLSVLTIGLSEGVAISGPPAKFQREIEQFNADVAAWNKRCKITRTDAEEAWCKKERARIDARRKELVALGALPK
jgi:hypothetical protein